MFLNNYELFYTFAHFIYYLLFILYMVYVCPLCLLLDPLSYSFTNTLEKNNTYKNLFFNKL